MMASVRLSKAAAKCVPLELAATLVLLGCTPDIPHPIESRTDEYCRTCHVGRAGAPSSHDKTGCVSCHESTSTGPYPAVMPHPGGEPGQCSLCHRDGTADAAVTPHLAESDCYSCHQAPEYESWPRAIPHEVDAQDRASCLDCHKDIDHPDRPNCTDCHRI